MDAAHPTHAARPVGCWAPAEDNLAIEQTSASASTFTVRSIWRPHNKTYATYREVAEAALDFLRKKVPKCWPEFCNSVTDSFRVINPKDFRVLA